MAATSWVGGPRERGPLREVVLRIVRGLPKSRGADRSSAGGGPWGFGGLRRPASDGGTKRRVLTAVGRRSIEEQPRRIPVSRRAPAAGTAAGARRRRRGATG